MTPSYCHNYIPVYMVYFYTLKTLGENDSQIERFPGWPLSSFLICEKFLECTEYSSE